MNGWVMYQMKTEYITGDISALPFISFKMQLGFFVLLVVFSLFFHNLNLIAFLSSFPCF